MTLPATLFGTTVRVLRTAAGRRALQLVLLVGGLFLLGFLCGEQAHAAEGTPTAPVASVAPVSGLLLETGHSSTSGGTEAVPGSRNTAQGSVGDATRGSGAGAGQAVADSARDTGNSVRAATEHVVTPVLAVTERAVTPVRTVADTTTRSLDGIQAEVPDPSGRPELDAPGLPEVSEPPVLELPVPVPVGPEPLPREHGGGTPYPPASVGDSHPGGHAKSRTGVAAAPPSAAPGPFAPLMSSLLALPAAHRVGAPVDASGSPVPAPTGDPEGALGKQAADGTSFRHGDAHAVTLADRAPLRLVPGAAALVDAPHTRERHRDIPVFPG